MNPGKIFLGLVVVCVILGPLVAADTYYADAYPIDQANAYVDLAAASNNLTETLADLNTTLSMLGNYHGNPNPLFPTAHTNFDAIKQQIRATVASGVRVLNATPDSFAYQQALKNIQSDLTTTVEGELSDAAGAAWFWYGGWWAWVLIPATFPLAIFAVVTWEREERRW